MQKSFIREVKSKDKEKNILKKVKKNPQYI